VLGAVARKCGHRSCLNRCHESLDPHGSQSNPRGKARPESKAALLVCTLPGEPPSRLGERPRTLPWACPGLLDCREAGGHGLGICGRPRRSLGWPPGGYGPVQAVGVGSETIGAMQAGWDEVVGVELHRKYSAIAKVRLGYHAGDVYLACYLGVAAPGLLYGGRCDCQPGGSSTVPEPHTPGNPASFGATCAALPEEAPSPAAGRSPVLGRPRSVMKRPWFLRGTCMCGGGGFPQPTTHTVLFSGQGAFSSPC